MTNVLLDPNARMVIAHRGNRVAAPENTIVSLRQAVDLGADALEFDVRMTRDDVAVVIHDATVDRTTNGTGRVRDMTLAELRGLDAFAGHALFAGKATIPTLEEVFDAFRAIPFVIEVKEDAAVDATERIVRRFDAQSRVVIGSAENSVMQRFYRTGLISCASSRDAALMIPLSFVGFLPLKPRYEVLSIPPTFRGMPVPVTRMASLAKRYGIPTHVWTVNDPAQGKSLWGAGVAGIVTDDPAALLRVRAG